jgi:hypothetical protein
MDRIYIHLRGWADSQGGYRDTGGKGVRPVLEAAHAYGVSLYNM